MSNLPESTLGELLKLADAVMSAMPTMFHSTEKHEQFVSAEKKLAQALTPSTVSALIRELQQMRKDLESGFMEGAYARLKNLQAAEAERDRLEPALIQCKSVLKWLDSQGGLGFEKHKKICEVGELAEAALTAKEEGKHD
jgi:hypothetical protein